MYEQKHTVFLTNHESGGGTKVDVTPKKRISWGKTSTFWDGLNISDVETKTWDGACERSILFMRCIMDMFEKRHNDGYATDRILARDLRIDLLKNIHEDLEYIIYRLEVSQISKIFPYGTAQILIRGCRKGDCLTKLHIPYIRKRINDIKITIRYVEAILKAKASNFS